MIFLFTLFICIYAILGGVYILQRPRNSVVDILRHVIAVGTAIVSADVVAFLCAQTTPQPIPALMFGFVFLFFIAATSMLAPFQRFSIFIALISAISLILWAPLGLKFGTTADDAAKKVFVVFAVSLVAYGAFVYLCNSSAQKIADFCAGYLLGGSVITIARILIHQGPLDDFRPSAMIFPKTPEDVLMSYKYHLAAIACGLVTFAYFRYLGGSALKSAVQKDERDPEVALLDPYLKKSASDYATMKPPKATLCD